MPQFRRFGGGKHEMNTGHRPRRGDIDEAKMRMGMWRTHDDAVQEIGRCVIGDIASLSAHQRFVFLARDRLTDAEFHCRLEIALISAWPMVPAFSLGPHGVRARA